MLLPLFRLLTATSVLIVAGSQRIATSEEAFPGCQTFNIGRDRKATDRTPLSNPSTVAIYPGQLQAKPVVLTLSFNFADYVAVLDGERISMEKCNKERNDCETVVDKNIVEPMKAAVGFTYITVRPVEEYNVIIIEINGKKIEYLPVPSDIVNWSEGATWHLKTQTGSGGQYESEYFVQFNCTVFPGCRAYNLGKDYTMTNPYPLVDYSTVAISPLKGTNKPIYFRFVFSFAMYKALLIQEMFSVELCNKNGKMCSRVLNTYVEEARRSGSHTYLTVRLYEEEKWISILMNDKEIASIDVPDVPDWPKGATWYVEAGPDPTKKGASTEGNSYFVQFNCTGLMEGRHVSPHPGVDNKKPGNDMHPYDEFPEDNPGSRPPLHSDDTHETGLRPSLHRDDTDTGDHHSTKTHVHGTKKTPLEHTGKKVSGKQADQSVSPVGLIVGIVIGCLVVLAIIFIVVKAIRGRKSANINEKSQLQEEGVK